LRGLARDQAGFEHPAVLVRGADGEEVPSVSRETEGFAGLQQLRRIAWHVDHHCTVAPGAYDPGGPPSQRVVARHVGRIQRRRERREDRFYAAERAKAPNGARGAAHVSLAALAGH